MPGPTSAKHFKAVNAHASNLLSCYVLSVTATSVQVEQVAPPSSEPNARTQHSSGQQIKR